MKRAYFVVVFLLSFLSAFAKEIADTGKPAPSNFIFKKYSSVTEKGIESFIAKLDSAVPKTGRSGERDSMLKMVKETFPAFLTEKSDTYLYIEVRNDSIWRYNKQKDQMIGDYFMIQKDSGILHSYDKSKMINYDKFDLFAIKAEIKITENRNDKKIINGFNCFKLILVVKKIDEEDQLDLGSTIYEMYVTDQIKLPVHSVINLTKLIPDLFPMEIKIMEEGLPGMVETYELIELN